MTDRRQRDQACVWCGSVIVDNEVGRRRKYCKRSCRQRAYEQRTLVTGTGIPGDAVILSREEAEALADRLFALRCAAEDLVTAVTEQADAEEIRELGSALLQRAGEAERLR